MVAANAAKGNISTLLRNTPYPNNQIRVGGMTQTWFVRLGFALGFHYLCEILTVKG